MASADNFRQFISTQLTSAATEILEAFKNIVDYEEIVRQSKLQFIDTRLTAAADEIFGAFKNIIHGYEKEIGRQRRLMVVVRTPDIKLHRIELPLQDVCKMEEVLSEQQHYNQEGNSLMDLEDSEAPQMKEEHEEPYASQEGEQLEVKQETDASILTSTYEANDHSEEKTLYLNSNETLRAPQKESAVHKLLIISVVKVPNSDQPLSNNSHAAENRDLKGKAREDVKFGSEIHFKTNTGERPYICKLCGKVFKNLSAFSVHMTVHTELPLQHPCKKEEVLSDQQSCEQESKYLMDQENTDAPQMEEEELGISQQGEQLEVKQETDGFMLTPTNEKIDHSEEKAQHLNPDEHLSAAQKQSTVHIPVIISGVSATNSALLPCNNSNAAERRDVEDFRVYTGDGPYICKPCGRVFKLRCALSGHMRVHTGEKPYTCDTCGQDYRYSGQLTDHILRAHTGERPYHCKICWKSFPVNSAVKKHMLTHTDERPYVCETCGKAYRRKCDLTLHQRKVHTDEGLYFANMWKPLHRKKRP